jgi:hypothetical protein
VAAVSERALIILAAPDVSFAQLGTRPQRMVEIWRTGSFGFWRITGIAGLARC